MASNYFASSAAQRSLEDELEQVLHEFAPQSQRSRNEQQQQPKPRFPHRGVRVESDSEDYTASTTSDSSDDDGDTDDESGTFSTINDEDEVNIINHHHHQQQQQQQQKGQQQQYNKYNDKEADDHIASGAFVAPAQQPPVVPASRKVPYHVSREQLEKEREELESEQRAQRYSNFGGASEAPLIRNGWDAIASVNDCVSDLERELAALMCHHRKHCQVSRRALTECDDRIKWLDELATLIEKERSATKSLRDVLANESADRGETELTVRNLSQQQKTLSEKDFFPLDLEEVRVDTRLKKLDEDAAELQEVLKTLKVREAEGKSRQGELQAREVKVRQEMYELDTRDRRRKQVELNVAEREKTATRHESAIDTWSRTLDAREGELQKRKEHLDQCFQALEKAETHFGSSLASSSGDAATSAGKQQTAATLSKPNQQQPGTQPLPKFAAKSHQQAAEESSSSNNNINMNATMSTMSKTTSAMIGAALPHLALEPEALAVDEEDDI